MKKNIFIIAFIFVITLLVTTNIVNAETIRGNINITTLEYAIGSSNTTPQWYNTSNGEEEIDITYPTYNLISKSNVGISAFAEEDIKDTNNNILYNKGSKVATAYSDNYGEATFNSLPLGKYKIVQNEESTGNNQGEPMYVELSKNSLDVHLNYVTNENSHTSQVTVEFDRYTEKVKNSVYAVYAAESIKNYRGDKVIYQDEAMGFFTFEDGAPSSVNLPVGKYYIKNIYQEYPYILDNEIINLEITSGGSKVKVSLKAEEEIYTSGSLTILPIFYNNDSEKNSKINELIHMTTEEQYDYLADGGYYFHNVIYNIYSDEEKENLLFSIDADGQYIVHVDEIPKGYYYVEVISTDNFLEYDEIDNFHISSSSPEVVLFQGIRNGFISDDPTTLPIEFYYDDGTIKSEYAQDVLIRENGGIIESIPNMRFEITTEDNSNYYSAITDCEGNISIYEDFFKNGNTYTFKILELDEDLYSEVEREVTFKYIKGITKSIRIPIKINTTYGLKGDLDFNGVIDANDASLLLEIYKSENWSSADLPIADMDNNNVIDANDASLILEYYKTH